MNSQRKPEWLRKKANPDEQNEMRVAVNLTPDIQTKSGIMLGMGERVEESTGENTLLMSAQALRT